MRVNAQENRCQDTKHETARRGEFRRQAVRVCSPAWQETKHELNAAEEATVRDLQLPLIKARPVNASTTRCADLCMRGATDKLYALDFLAPVHCSRRCVPAAP
ncbi:hypothetical protein NDU88_000800 [Pleurodeles waltl]|uniref:Uncharacterized protein n=1 Tax=Pleurodeles waltl TaxID=8319 RepID=A0AAV7R581_PLEWA|nr:hypothetical protein NDU88_000800 [Pleurodeles waltl]